MQNESTPNGLLDAAMNFDEAMGLDDEFDPLAVDDLDINQEDMDDDNPLDVIDYPTMRNMPEGMRRAAVYTPERMGSIQEALRSLFDHNPARRPVLTSILALCEGGCPASTITEMVEAKQEHNRSVYAPMTLCRMLERAGALRLELPETSTACEDVAEGVEYLEIKERIDPVWHTTTEGQEVYESLVRGDAFRDIVLDRDSVYIDVYAALMDALCVEPLQKETIEELVDTFEVVKSPRRFGGHFVDMLERVDALEWKDSSWQLTDLGRSMIPEVKALQATHAKSAC